MTKLRKKDIYPGVADAAARRRIGAVPVMTIEDIGEPFYKTLSVEEVADVNVDETYQRRRVDRVVDEIAEVLRQGGVIPDDVCLAVRPDGTVWVVDGQQRWWAHLSEGVAMPAKCWHVPDIQTEKRLFDVLNNRVNLTSATVIKAWPGPTKDLLSWLDNDQESGLRARIGWGGNSTATFRVELVTSAILSMSANIIARGGVRDRLIRLDAEMKRLPTWLPVATRQLSQLLNEIFPGQNAAKFKAAIAIAIGRSLHNRWNGLYERDTKHWPYPSPAQVQALRSIDWYTEVPMQSSLGVPRALEVFEKRWPMPPKRGR